MNTRATHGRPARLLPRLEPLEERTVPTAGSLDADFGQDGQLFLEPIAYGNEQARSVAVQNDGKIVIAGFAEDARLNDVPVKMRVTRLLANGDPDRTFDRDGSVLIDVAVSAVVAALVSETVSLVLQPDGKILVGSSTPRGGSDYDFLIVRLNGSDGSLDAGFGNGGVQRINFNLPGGGSDDRLGAMTLDHQGRIVLAGIAHAAGESEVQAHVAVARLRGGDGSLDTSFGQMGKFTAANNALITGVAMQGDRIIVAGTTGWNFLVGRLTADGALDRSFNDDGWHQGHFDNPDRENGAEAMAVQPWDNKIVLVGAMGVGGGGTDFAVARLDANGRLDPGFDGNGSTHFHFTSNFTEDHPYTLVLQDDHKIVVSGFNQLGDVNSTEFGFAIARLTEAGQLDRSFAGDGKQQFIFPGSAPGQIDDKPFGSVLQRDGKLLLVGHSEADARMSMVIARLTADPLVVPPPPPPPTPTSGSPMQAPQSLVRRSVLGQLITRTEKGKKRQFLRLVFGDTREVIWEQLSPFQASVYRALAVAAIDSDGDGVPDAAVLTARKGTRTVQRTFTV